MTTASHNTSSTSARRSIHAGPTNSSPAASSQNARGVRPKAARRPARAVGRGRRRSQTGGGHFGTSTAARRSAVI